MRIAALFIKKLPCLIAGCWALSAAPSFYTSLASFTTASGTPTTLGFNSVVTPFPPSSDPSQRIAANYGNLPLSFEPNQARPTRSWLAEPATPYS